MRHRRTEPPPTLITDAQPSLEQEQRARKRVYSVLMVVHLLGLFGAGMLVWLVADYWVLALVIVAVTGPVPWLAVVLANSPRFGQPEGNRAPGTARELNRPPD